MGIGTLARDVYCILTVVGPVLNYYPQYRLMDRNRSVGSFSKNVCYLLIVSSLLRVIFW